MYVLGDLGDLVKFDKKSGKELWRKHLVKDFKGRRGKWDYAESVLLDGDNLIVTPGGTTNTMVALKKSDGSLVWGGKDAALEMSDATAGYGSAIKAKVNGKEAYVTTLHMGRIIAFDAATGAHLFTNDAIKSDAASGTCSAAGDRIICNCGYSGGGLTQLDVSGAKPKLVWKEKVREVNDKTSSAIKVENRVFGIGDGLATLYAVDWKSGELLNPGRGERLLGKQSAGLTYADGKLILTYANGVVALWSAEDKPKQISNFILPGADSGQDRLPLHDAGRGREAAPDPHRRPAHLVQPRSEGQHGSGRGAQAGRPATGSRASIPTSISRSSPGSRRTPRST